jgi:aminomethyltransferase
MGQIRWHGKDRAAFLERVLTASVADMEVGSCALSVITNAQGGIIDDTVITNAGSHVGMVVNGACKWGDMKHFEEQMDIFRAQGGDVAMEYLEDRQLLALQGPAAAAALAGLTDVDLGSLGFMEATEGDVAGVRCGITRCGYTGEDGFEVSIPFQHTEEVAKALCADSRVLPAGLAARDSLRLEAGLCLYGNDIDGTTTPVEAGLLFTIPKARRQADAFIGADVIVGQIKDKSLVKRKRVGLTILQGGPARPENSVVVTEDGTEVGPVTSGTFSPTLKQPIAMAYVPKQLAKKGTKLGVKVRGKVQAAEVTKMPFVPAKYYRKPQA